MSRPFGSAADLERRRMRAIEVINEGESPETLARTLRVNRSSVYRWLKLAEKKDGLIAKPHSGPAPRLSSVQLQELEALMLQGAQAHGWLNQLWTCARVRELIRRRFGVSLHHDHIGRIPRAAAELDTPKAAPPSARTGRKRHRALETKHLSNHCSVGPQPRRLFGFSR